MDNESYMEPIGYEKWFTETNAFCDTGIMLKKFTPYSDVTELVMDLTDCLKDFFCTVRELVKDIESLHAAKNHYIARPIIAYLFMLKRSIYNHIYDILNRFPQYENSDARKRYFEELVKKNIFTNEEKAIATEFAEQRFLTIAGGIIWRDTFISVDYADDSSEIYFSIKDNKHINMDEAPHLVLGAPYEIEPGLINLKYWAVTELFRVNKMTEICAKITTESPEIKKSILSTSFNAKELISAFEYLSR